METIKKSIKSVHDQGVPCGVESCSEVSAAFVYHANTGKTVLQGEANDWDDAYLDLWEVGPWEVAYVEVLDRYPHNVAYHPKTNKVVDLSLGQFSELKTDRFEGTKESYLSLTKGTNWVVQKYTVPDTLSVLAKTLKRKFPKGEKHEQL